MITTEQKLRCVEREIVQRRRVYARLVAENRMSKAKADRELEIMAAIADDYHAKLDAEMPTLFAG